MSLLPKLSTEENAGIYVTCMTIEEVVLVNLKEFFVDNILVI